MISRKLKKSVLVPIIFFNWFNFPLTIKEIRRYLWQGELSEENIIDVIKEFTQINYQDGQVWHGEDRGKRIDQQQLADQLWQVVGKWRWLFSLIPFLSEVYVTNTLAYNNVHTNSDIDLLVVAKPGRLWTTRLFLIMWLNLFKLRVKSIQRFKKFSPEFFVSEKALNIKSLALEHDYYLSYWLADLVSIWPDGEHRKFRQANSWFKDDLPITWSSPKLKTYRYLRPTIWRLTLEKLLAGKWGQKLEDWAYYKQKKIIEKNVRRLGVHPSVTINHDIIKLHFNDRRALIRDVIETTLNDWLVKGK